MTILVNVLWIVLGLLGAWTAFFLFRRRNFFDRLLGFDILGLLLVGAFILLAIERQDSFFLDLALALGGLGFVATVAWAQGENRP
jgi:multisubunit Na+/H+ antiporter MnhF subunit